MACRGKGSTELIGSSEEPAPTLIPPVSLQSGERGSSLCLRNLLQDPEAGLGSGWGARSAFAREP
jgi:hypothetical protein